MTQYCLQKKKYQLQDYKEKTAHQVQQIDALGLYVVGVVRCNACEAFDGRRVVEVGDSLCKGPDPSLSLG